MTDPNAIFKQFTERVADDFPELQQTLNDAKTGAISEQQALAELTEIMGGSPDLRRRFRDVAMGTLAPLREEDKAQPLDHGGLIIHNKRGLPRLNPLVEAALAERAQFDGDIPELRTGGQPEGVAPAVSVETTGRSSVVIGQMLKQASDQVAGKVAAKEPERQAMVADAALLNMVEQGGTALAIRKERGLVLDGQSSAVDAPEYRRGQLPVPVRVTQPSGSVLLALTPEERKKSAWQFLSTSQGRRSAESGILQIIEAKLKGEGYKVRTRPYSPTSNGMVLATHEWTVNIDGAGSMQASFSFIDTAAAVIAKTLAKTAGHRDHDVILEVTSVNTVNIRSVGWAGRLMSDNPVLPAGGGGNS